jgi:hypothetical protein
MMKPTPIAVLSLMAVALSALLPAGSNAANKDELSPLQLARKLNQAFVEVADSVAQSVVVLKVTHRADYVDANEEENPLFEMLPPEFRRRMDEQREERRRDQERQRRFHREPFYDGEELVDHERVVLKIATGADSRCGDPIITVAVGESLRIVASDGRELDVWLPAWTGREAWLWVGDDGRTYWDYDLTMLAGDRP